MYVIIHNTFHYEIFKYLYKKSYFDFGNVKLIVIPYKIDLNDISHSYILINTPYNKEKRIFWNPINFINAKKEIKNKIDFKNETFLFFTEYDPLTQYIIYNAKINNGKTYLVEEGIATYYSFIKKNYDKLRVKDYIKLSYLKILGFHYIEFMKFGRSTFLKMDDRYIDKIFLNIKRIKLDRNIKHEYIDIYPKFDMLDNTKAVFLNQPLYKNLLDENQYFVILNLILNKLSREKKQVFFKFHPRDEEKIKTKIFSLINKFSNISIIDSITLEEFLNKEKPYYGYSIYSDGLLKMYYQGMKVYFAYNLINNYHEYKIFQNLDILINKLKDDRFKLFEKE